MSSEKTHPTKAASNNSDANKRIAHCKRKYCQIVRHGSFWACLSGFNFDTVVEAKSVPPVFYVAWSF